MNDWKSELSSLVKEKNESDQRLDEIKRVSRSRFEQVVHSTIKPGIDEVAEYLASLGFDVTARLSGLDIYTKRGGTHLAVMEVAFEQQDSASQTIVMRQYVWDDRGRFSYPEPVGKCDSVTKEMVVDLLGSKFKDGLNRIK